MVEKNSVSQLTFCLRRGLLKSETDEYSLSYSEAKILEYFLDNQNQTINKETLKNYAWEHSVVTDSSLIKAIARLRTALDNFFPDNDIIITVPRIGYKLVLDQCSISKNDLVVNSAIEPENAPKKIFSNKNIKQLSIIGVSVFLLLLSLFNIYESFPKLEYGYLNSNYQMSSYNTVTGNFKVIHPVNYKIENNILSKLEQIECECIYLIEGKNDYLSLSFYNTKTKSNHNYSFTLDKLSITLEKIQEEINQ